MRKNSALEYHLYFKHTPPVPTEWLPICERIIEMAPKTEEEFHEFLRSEVDNPINPDHPLTVNEVINGLTLWDFINPNEVNHAPRAKTITHDSIGCNRV